jgi:hypothetical protein
VTVEGFLVVDKSTFDKWCETHPIDGLIEETSIGEEPGPIAAKFKGGSNVQYIYENGRLNGCKISAANGRVIDEAVQVDLYGRIIKIARTPESETGTLCFFGCLGVGK